MQSRKAFTLIELLIAVSIIGLLLAAAAVSIQAAQASSRDSKRIGDVATIGKALDAYASANAGRYPTASAAVTCPNAFGTPSKLQPYLPAGSTFPTDPRPPRTGNCTYFTNGYKYYANTAGTPANTLQQRYIIITGLEKGLSTDSTTLTLGSSLTGISSSTVRTPYYLPGPYCGANC
jgi:prepilin-type N-terminal cleavage/methylation domain-containing protein